ncbi:MAG: metal ABC transporter ATP-binding protein [Candidatus Paracaedibacteraceae bacterium]|nr:metal ABC transporter ATP-binding protein [Candidatus Paracaedibacteraceae bacterium]
MKLITLSNLTYMSKSTNQCLIDDVTFDISAKTITTIIGPNGAGKTTLLRLILKLLMPTSGAVIQKPGIKLGYMPQKLNLNVSLPLTVERFLKLSSPVQSRFFVAREKNDAILSMLEQVNACYTLKQNVHTLSGGEWQRVLLARALLQSPDVLVLDEPVQGLDLAGQSEFYQMLHHIRNVVGCAVVHVSHDLHLVWDASDHVICLNKHICCLGHPDQVRLNPEVQRLFGGFLPYTHHHDHSHNGANHSNCEHSHD